MKTYVYVYAVHTVYTLQFRMPTSGIVIHYWMRLSIP